ncbi:MAG: dihydrofolate reductase [Clostridia bacterium]|nr:dihydrofolate reductase [Clostridia bacterium]
MIAIIVAYSKNRVIGKDGKIPWNIEGEKERFRRLTEGCTVIMGRKTYEEIGRPLPNRKNIVVSRTKVFSGKDLTTAQTLGDAIRTAKNGDIFIAGGEGIYAEALPLCEKLYITEIHAEFDGDTFFPEFDESLYNKEIVSKINGLISYTYLTYTKI